jgi:hypothetical protein
MKLTPGEAFSVHFVWQMANKFVKKFANLSLKFGVLFVGEIGSNFFAKSCVQATFCLAKNVW